jgi:hypothetical protein
MENQLQSVPMTSYKSNGGTLVPLEKVKLKPGWQGPQFFSDEKAKSIAKQMRAGAEFAPIEVEKTEDCFLVLDGHHRLAASQQCSFTEIPVTVVPWAGLGSKQRGPESPQRQF